MIPLKRHILANNRRCKCGYEVHFLGREVYTEGKNGRKAGAGYEKNCNYNCEKLRQWW